MLIMTEAYSNQMPITPPDTIRRLPDHGNTSDNDGLQGPFFNIDTIEPEAEECILETAKDHGEGIEIVRFALKTLGIIHPKLPKEPKTPDEKLAAEHNNAINDRITHAGSVYASFFEDYQLRHGLNTDRLVALYDQSKHLEHLPLLSLFVNLQSTYPNYDNVADSSRIVRILVLEDNGETLSSQA